VTRAPQFGSLNIPRRRYQFSADGKNSPGREAFILPLTVFFGCASLRCVTGDIPLSRPLFQRWKRAGGKGLKISALKNINAIE
jgi:hypothetical protein